MTDRVERSGLKVDAGLAQFIEGDVLAPLGQDAGAFWQGFAALVNSFAPRNRELLARRDSLQAQIDEWHQARAGKPLDPASFELFIEMIRKVHGQHLLRVKGIVCLADDPGRPLVIHGVQHIFHPPVRLATWPGEDRSTRLVCILHNLDPAHIEGLWDAFNGGIAIDRPDAAGLTVNPLKPQGGGLLD